MESIDNIRVILFKASSREDDKYSRLLNEHGIQNITIPVLQFEFSKPQALWDCLKQPRSYSGIVMSSPRVVQSLKEAINLYETSKNEWNDYLSSKWNTKSNYVVGKATQDAAADIGLFNILGQNTGSAEKLADYIIDVNCSQLTILLPTGNLSSDEFSNKLNYSGINTEKLIVYQTIEHSELNSNINSNLFNVPQSRDVFVFFSPSGFRYSLSHFKSLNFDIDSLKFVAIGATTEREITSLDCHCLSVAESPTPNSLLCSIREVIASAL